MKRLILASAIFAASVAAASPRVTIPLDRGWLFNRGDSLAAPTDTVDLPHDYLISQPWVEPSPDELPDLDNPMANVKSRLSARGFKEPGTGWYRLRFTPADSLAGRRLLLDFGGIMLTGDVILNGEKVGGTDYGYLGFECDVTGKLRPGEENEIVVRADAGKPENSRWYTGAGLYRGVSLVATDPKHFFARHPLSVTSAPAGDGSSWNLFVGAEIASRHRPDSIRVRVQVADPDGREVYSALRTLRNNRRQKVREFEVDTVTIASPRLWDCDNPALYTMTLSLIDSEGRVTDSVSRPFGIRSVEYSPEFGLKLNGRKVLLKGIANHHTLGALGAAAYPRAIEKRIQLLKKFGFNHIRTSHNPYSEEFLDLCDRYGILVVDELYDKWTSKFAGGRVDWMTLWPRDIPEWIKRDRCHPSVVMWSLGNELQMMSDLPFNDWGVTAYRLQKTLLDKYDTTRPVTVAMHPRGRGEFTDSVPAPLVLATDIASYNYRYMYFPGDSRRYPGLIFYQSEANTSGIGTNWFGMDLDRVTGLAYWGMIDYLGESNGWPAKGWMNGVFDISLRPKPLAYFVKSYFLPDEPEVHIAVIEARQGTEWNGITVGGDILTDHWNRAEGDTLNLYTFTNADEVELRINGRSLGRKPNDISDPSRRNRILWEGIPYSKGRIEAIAYKDGRETARHKVETTGRASRLTAEPDNNSWRSDGSDLQHIVISAADPYGRIVPDADFPLDITVDGPAVIAGVANGDLTSDESFAPSSPRHASRSLHAGTAQLILRSLPASGSAASAPKPVTVTVTAPGVRPVTLRLPFAQ